MSLLGNSRNTPVKTLFSSVFRREDIRNVTPKARENHFRSFSCTSGRNNTTEERIEIVDALDGKNQDFLMSNLDCPRAKENFEYNNEIKFADMSKRYERMQDFYKTQVARLTEEVNHYKTLYHKLLVQQSAERKIYKH